MQDDSLDELHFQIIRAPVQTTAPLSEDQKLQQNEHFKIRVLNQSSEQ